MKEINWEKIFSLIIASGLVVFFLNEIVNILSGIFKKIKIKKLLFFELEQNYKYLQIIESCCKLKLESPIYIFQQYGFIYDHSNCVFNSGLALNLNFELIKLLNELRTGFRNIEVRQDEYVRITREMGLEGILSKAPHILGLLESVISECEKVKSIYVNSKYYKRKITTSQESPK